MNDKFKDLFPIEREIHEALNEKAQQLYQMDVPDKEWTRAFKQELFNMGEKKNYEAWCHGVEKPTGEWLWDLTWVKVGETGWKDFRGVVLATEIEWGYSEDDQLEDFLKLVVAKAEYRLFVFSLGKGDEEHKAEERFDFLMKACPGSEGARYMAIGVPCNRPEMLPYRAWTL